MSECDRVLKLLSDYIDGVLPPADARELDRHFEDCPECLTFLQSLRQTIALSRAVTYAEIPEPVRERLHAFLRERLDSMPAGGEESPDKSRSGVRRVVQPADSQAHSGNRRSGGKKVRT